MRIRWATCALVVGIFHGCSGNSSPPSGSSSGASSGSGGSGNGGGASTGQGGSGGGSSGQVGGSGQSSGQANTSGQSSSGANSGSSGQVQSGSGSGSGNSGSSGRDGGTTTYPPLTSAMVSALRPTLVPGTYYFTEGPVWDPVNKVLYFTDINAQQNGTTGGAIYRLTLPSTVDVFLQPAGNTDGIGLDPQGHMIGAGFASRNAWRLAADNKTMQTLAPCSSGGGTCFMGTKVNTPDDITARSDGVIYFTDPTFGSGAQGLPAQSLPLGYQAVFRLTTDGMLHREDMTTSGPNGVNLSPDEKTLYVAYTLGSTVAKFTVAADGSLSNKTTFASATLADSMCVDAGGNVYVGTQSGLAVFTPSGQSLGTISVGGQITTNCAFGGPSQTTIFITARSQATLIGTPTAGSGFLYKIDNMPVPGIPGQN
jgi:gluconolactonase